MATVWALAETRGDEVKQVSLELLTAARQLVGDGTVVAVLLGNGLEAATATLAAGGADRVLHVADGRLSTFSPDGAAAGLAAVARREAPDIILGPATFRGRDFTARLAAELDVAMAQDVTGLAVENDHLVATRPIYAGKAISTVDVGDRPHMATIRPNSYPAATGAGAPAPVETIELDAYTPGAVITSVEAATSARPDVAEADIIVSGGRGMGGPEHFHLVEELADALGAAVGASRAAVDAGWRPHSEQVGQTGKTVSPSLYIACGISGAVQHLAGMKTSKYIVAVNKDAEAPIFGVADYGIVGDVFDVLPALTKAIRNNGAA